MQQRTKKIRGHKRIWKEIEEWKNYHLELDLDYLKESGKDYVKIRVRPYGNISVLNSEIPAPKYKTRKLVLKALLDIYNSWYEQLKTLNQPYYLKIWLYEPNLSSSQIVCAIGPYLEWYNATFYKPEKQKQFRSKNYGSLTEQLNELDWEYAYEDNHFTSYDLEIPVEDYFNERDYIESQKWYRKQLKRNPRVAVDDNNTTCYSTRRGTVWIGGK